MNNLSLRLMGVRVSNFKNAPKTTIESFLQKPSAASSSSSSSGSGSHGNGSSSTATDGGATAPLVTPVKSSSSSGTSVVVPPPPPAGGGVGGGGLYVCPICEKTLPSKDNGSVNRHVDECLGIKESGGGSGISTERDRGGGASNHVRKRPASSSSSSKGGKKGKSGHQRKSQSPCQPGIESYFGGR